MKITSKKFITSLHVLHSVSDASGNSAACNYHEFVCVCVLDHLDSAEFSAKLKCCESARQSCAMCSMEDNHEAVKIGDLERTLESLSWAHV